MDMGHKLEASSPNRHNRDREERSFGHLEFYWLSSIYQTFFRLHLACVHMAAAQASRLLFGLWYTIDTRSYHLWSERERKLAFDLHVLARQHISLEASIYFKRMV